MKTKIKLSNSGDYIDRITTNVILGWKYPEAIVIKVLPSGKSRKTGMNHGNLSIYYHFDGSFFHCLGTIPSWAGDYGRSKYDSIRDKIKELRSMGLKTYGLQQFITIREIK